MKNLKRGQSIDGHKSKSTSDLPNVQQAADIRPDLQKTQSNQSTPNLVLPRDNEENV